MSESNGTAVAVQQTAAPAKPQPSVGQRGIEIRTFDELWRFAIAVHKGGFGPKGVSPEGIFVAAQMGLELGLSVMSGIQSTAVINGRPGIFGDAAIGIVRNSHVCEYVREWFELGGQVLTTAKGTPRGPTNAELQQDGLAAVCEVKRKGDEPAATTFAVEDAKRAGLWGKAGPWTQYPGRMLRFRARGFALRDTFADVLKGFKTAEELQDYTPSDSTYAVVVDPAKPEATRAETLLAQLHDAVPEATESAEPETAQTPVSDLPDFDAIADSIQDAFERAGSREEWDAAQGMLKQYTDRLGVGQVNLLTKLATARLNAIK